MKPPPLRTGRKRLRKMETETKVRWMCPKQAAERLGISAETARRWLRDGEIPGHKIRGTWLVPVAFLDGLETGR